MRHEIIGGVIGALLSGMAAAEPAADLDGRVTVSGEDVSYLPTAALATYARKHLGDVAIGPDREGLWAVHFQAFLRKPSQKGWISVFVFDHNDPSEPLFVRSFPNRDAVREFQNVVELDPDLGFEAGHRYDIRVGYIVGEKGIVLARGEFVLDAADGRARTTLASRK